VVLRDEISEFAVGDLYRLAHPDGRVVHPQRPPTETSNSTSNGNGVPIDRLH
jgi:hypothetical protein